MASRRETLLLVAAGALAATAGTYFARSPSTDDHAAGVPGLLNAPLRDLEGRDRRIVEWAGRILVCNFWATWCAPCREEIPALGRLRARMSANGVEIVGIAIDHVAKVIEYVKALNIAYPIVLADAGGIEMMRQLGNSAGGLPFTVVLDRKGNLVYRKLGQIGEADLEKRLVSIV